MGKGIVDLSGAWKKKDKNGDTFYGGRFEYGPIKGFINVRKVDKKSDKQADLQVQFCPDDDCDFFDALIERERQRKEEWKRKQGAPSSPLPDNETEIPF